MARGNWADVVVFDPARIGTQADYANPAQPPEGIYVIAGRILTFCYFAYFLILLPLLSRIENPRPLPNSIADDVLAKHGGKVASAIVAFVVAGGLLVGGAQNARAEDHSDAPPAQSWSIQLCE